MRNRCIATQSIQTILSGSTYILSDITRGSGFKPIIQHEQQPIQQLILQTLITTGPQQNSIIPTEQPCSLDAHWGARKKTYDYFN
jgi:hypothetical protein